MRFARALLLLLIGLLPALLAPAGLRIERCECTGQLRLVVGAASKPCRAEAMAALAPRLAPTAPRSCCADATASLQRPGEHASACDEPSCACQASIAPEPSPKRTQAPPQFDLPVLCVGMLAVAELPPTLPVARLQPGDARAPPPPDAQRNLPLLL
jgi:hypothetical protein